MEYVAIHHQQVVSDLFEPFRMPYYRLNLPEHARLLEVCAAVFWPEYRSFHAVWKCVPLNYYLLSKGTIERAASTGLRDLQRNIIVPLKEKVNTIQDMHKSFENDTSIFFHKVCCYFPQKLQVLFCFLKNIFIKGMDFNTQKGFLTADPNIALNSFTGVNERTTDMMSAFPLVFFTD